MVGSQWADDLARAAALVSDEPTGSYEHERTWLGRLCRATRRSLTASGAGVSVMTASGVHAVAAASDDGSSVLEDLQFTLGEGPCIDAHATRLPVLIPDLDADAADRWPAYTPAARERGVRAVFAFPMLADATRVGVLDVYQEKVGQMSGASIAQGETFAELAAMMLLRVEDDDGLGLGSRAEVHQAQGMVMVQLDVSLAEALIRLRAYAFAQNVPISDVARAVVGRRLWLERDD